MNNVFVSLFIEQLRCKRAAEISPPALSRQVRLAARMLTVGVDTAAAVVNLHMVTRDQGYNYAAPARDEQMRSF